MKPRRAQSPIRTVLWIVALALLAGMGAWGVNRLTRAGVTVTEAVEAPVVQAFYSTGTMQPEREFPIRANVAGILTEVHVDKGDRVKAGDVLAVVTEPSLQYALDKAQAELAEKLARADEKRSPVLLEFDRRIDSTTGMLAIADREQARQQQAMESRAGSQADLDRAMDRVKLLTMDVEALRAQRAAKVLELAREVEVARSAVNTALWNLDQQTLRAPIDGVVLDRPTSRGTRVAVNDTLMRVADVTPARLVMRAAVDEEDIVNVSVGQLVQLTLYSFPGETFRGKVGRIYDQADAERRTFEVDVLFDSPHERFAPGMTGELAFILGQKDKAVVVPSQAVQAGAVWTVTSDGRLARNDVRIGLTSVERAEIISGIRVGETVVISPISSLQPGQRVRTSRIDPVQAAGINRKEKTPQGAAFKGIN